MSEALGNAQTELFHETLHDALRATVAALGGLKVVGSKLWPEKPIDEAARYLSDCLNADRPANLHPEKLLLLMRMSRERGVHLALHWICDDLGYTRPTPVEPEDQTAELQRQFIAAAESVKRIADRMARMDASAAQLRAVK